MGLWCRSNLSAHRNLDAMGMNLPNADPNWVYSKPSFSQIGPLLAQPRSELV